MSPSTISQPGVTRPAALDLRTYRATVAYAALAILVAYLPFSSMNAILGTIGAAARSGPGQLRWVSDGFTLTLTLTLLLGGALAQRHGAGRVVRAGLALTAAGSLAIAGAAGLTGNILIHLVQVAQILTGAGAGLAMSAGLVLVSATAPDPSARTRAISLWAAANVVGLGAGPFVLAATGFVAPWRWTFVLVALFALALAAFGAVRALPGAATTTRTPIRVVGTILRQAPQLVRHRGFTCAGLAAATTLFTVITVVFEVSLHLHAQRASSIAIALALGSLFAGNAVASTTSGHLQRRLSPRTLLLAGLLLILAGLVSLAGDTGAGVAGLAGRLALLGLGAGLVIATSTGMALQAVPAPLAPAAGTLHNTLRQLGGALGTAALADVSFGTALLVLLALVAITISGVVALGEPRLPTA